MLYPEVKIQWAAFVLVLIGCILAQAISNLVNDLVDFKSGIDTAEGQGRKGALVTGEMSYTEMLRGTVVICAIAALIGAWFTIQIGLPILIVVGVGALLAIEYTAPPLRLKYRGLGDLSVLIAFGIGMVAGAYFVQEAGQPGWLSSAKLIPLLLIALPSALLVVAILHANNHRDRDKDAKLGGRTAANLMSFKASQVYMFALVLLPYAIGLGLVAAGVLNPWALIVILSAPAAYVLLKKVVKSDFAGIVPCAARLHGQFGLLLAIAIVIQTQLLR